MSSKRQNRAGGSFSGFLTALGILAVYLALQLWVLPAAGVST